MADAADASALRPAIASTVTLRIPSGGAGMGFWWSFRRARPGRFTGDLRRPQEANDTADTLNWLRELSEVSGRSLYGFIKA